MYAIPVLGFIMYLLVGSNFHKRKIFHIKAIDDSVNEAAAFQLKELAHKNLGTEVMPQRYEDLIRYNLNCAGGFLTTHNRIEVFTDGSALFDDLLAEINAATSSIHLQFYIIQDDSLFGSISEALMAKAAAGVQVRILYDAIGSRYTSKSMWKRLSRHGIRVCAFFPALFGRFHLRINYRNHRKIVVIDGKAGYVGGFNIGNEYVGKSRAFGKWRDTHFKLIGDAVMLLQLRFAYDWNYAYKEDIFSDRGYFPMFPVNHAKTLLQIVPGGPDLETKSIRDNYLWLIANAKQRIQIQTPYFIPDESVLSALLLAIRCGVEVSLMIPDICDHPFVHWATLSFAGELILAGGNVYAYKGGFLHAKGIIADGEVFSYGTANFDLRSFELNFELNVIVYDKKMAGHMETLFINDMKECEVIDRKVYAERGLKVRFKEQLSRLLSPIL